jgi:hypothetical protein
MGCHKISASIGVYMPMNSYVIKTAIGVGCGLGYGLIFSNPIGLSGCALYGAVYVLSLDAFSTAGMALVNEKIKGTAETIATIAVSVFSIYASFFPANYFIQALGYSVSVIPTIGLATNLTLKLGLGLLLTLFSINTIAPLTFNAGVFTFLTLGS